MATMYDQTVVSYVRSLKAMQTCLDKAQKHADTKKFEVDVLCNSRLAPDMYPLVKQVQIACDNAKGTCARLIGKEPPKHEDNEKTFAELRQRIAKTVSYLETFKREDFNGCEDRKITMPWAPGKWMHGGEYVPQLALPNFYFHSGMCYAILRNSGVDVGKMDFLGNVNIQG